MKENKKADIEQAAYELFLINGYDNTSMRMIANRAKVAQSHAYFFFENKEDLLDNVLRMAQDSYKSKMYAAMQKYSSLPPEEFVVKCADVISGFRDEAAFVMACALMPKLRKKAEPVLKEYSEDIISMMKPLFPDLSDELLYNIGGLLLALSDSFIVDGDKERVKINGVFAMKILTSYLTDEAKQSETKQN